MSDPNVSTAQLQRWRLMVERLERALWEERAPIIEDLIAEIIEAVPLDSLAEELRTIAGSVDGLIAEYMVEDLQCIADKVETLEVPVKRYEWVTEPAVLDNKPDMTVIIDGNDDVAQRIAPGWTYVGSVRVLTGSALIAGRGPVRVLYEPGEVPDGDTTD